MDASASLSSVGSEGNVDAVAVIGVPVVRAVNGDGAAEPELGGHVRNLARAEFHASMAKAVLDAPATASCREICR